jgi:hypothetical protein
MVKICCSIGLHKTGSELGATTKGWELVVIKRMRAVGYVVTLQ